MSELRPIHGDFISLLRYKDQELIDLYSELRQFVLKLYPECNELLYHTHALTSVYTVSDKLGDAFCMIPIYTNHLNLGFTKGALLKDPDELLQGTGKLMRHIPIKIREDYKHSGVKTLLQNAHALAVEDCTTKPTQSGKIFSKIKA